MTRIAIRPARRADGPALLGLIEALADYEKLKPPTRAAQARLLRDAFGRRPRFEAWLAWDGPQPVGYAIVFETYSTFLAKPTLYLEDLFVLPSHRGRKIGLQLVRRCRAEARRRGCGRMEWMVLDWNQLARDFYHRQGARHMREWLLYRFEL